MQRTQVSLDDTEGDDVWTQAESCPVLERPMAEIALFGPDHALKVLELGGCEDLTSGILGSSPSWGT